MNSSSTTWGLKCKPRDLYGGLLPGSVWPIMFRPGVVGSNLFKSQQTRKILIGYHASKSILDLYASIYLIWKGDLDYLTLHRFGTPESFRLIFLPLSMPFGFLVIGLVAV